METKSLKVLITGSSGFVGKETCRVLEEAGHEVIPFDLMNGDQDITDYSSLERAVVESKPDRILHLAATARFSDADQNPERATKTNFIGTENVAVVSAKHHIPLVYASTGTVYMPIAEEMPITENFRVASQVSTYGLTKRLGELAVMRYCNPWIILRYGHLYGAEKKYHGLVGGILAKIRTGQKPQVWGGEQTNDFAYVKDIAQANLRALTATWENWNEIYNIGTGVEISTADAAQMVCDAVGYTGETEITSRRDVDPMRFVYDLSKARHMLHYEPRWSFEDGLKDMLESEKTQAGL